MALCFAAAKDFRRKNMKTILFDLREIQSSSTIKFHGGGLYGEIVFFTLLKRTSNLIGIYDSKRYMNPKILESGVKLYDNNKISLKDVVEKENVEILYEPIECYGTIESFEKISVKRFIVTWHGPRNLEMPYNDIEQYYARKSKELKRKIKILIKYDAIKNYFMKKIHKINKTFVYYIAYLENAEYMTVSEHSRHSIIGFYPHLAKKNIPVFYSPLNDELIEPSQPKFEPRSYFLLTSSARWIKNNLRAVWAFDELFNQRKDLDFKVILTGTKNEKIYTEKMKNRDKFIFLNYVDRAELLSLHKNAYAFIYPSLNEGFGYPPIESMRYGVPVAASGTSSIPEICQNAAIYFDPYNVSEIKNRILQLLDKNIYTEYSIRAIERYKIVSERQKTDLEKIVDFILGEKS
jgi:glycosyltransferase involved in cell wall biosynthesis